MLSPARRRRPIALSVAVVVALSLVAAACGGSDGGGGGGGGQAGGTSDIDPNGVLKYATILEVNSGVHFDPTKSVVVNDAQWMSLVMGTLLRENEKGEYVGWLAQSYDIPDSSTVKLTLRSGTRFSDGTAYDADAVAKGLLRTQNEPAPAAVVAGRQAAFKTLLSAVADDATHVTIKLSQPVAGAFVTSLVGREGVVVSPKQVASAPAEIDTKPIGAGPFTLASFTPLQVMSLKKSPTFFDADKWRYAGIDLVHAVPPATVNGLLAGSLDYTPVVEADVAKIEADSRYAVNAGKARELAELYLIMCTSKAPFDNKSFRQAIQKGINRKEVDELVFSGRGAPTAGFWGTGDVNYNKKVTDIAAFDAAAAKKLVTESGVANPAFDLWWISQVPEQGRVATVIQEQLGKIGIKVNLVASPDVISEFVQPQKPGMLLVPNARSGVDKYGRAFATGGTFALCGAPRPEVMNLVTQAAGLRPGDNSSAGLYQQAELLIAENAWLIGLEQPPTFTAWNKSRVGGDAKFQGSTGGLILDSIYVKK